MGQKSELLSEKNSIPGLLTFQWVYHYQPSIKRAYLSTIEVFS